MLEKPEIGNLEKLTLAVFYIFLIVDFPLLPCKKIHLLHSYTENHQANKASQGVYYFKITFFIKSPGG